MIQGKTYQILHGSNLDILPTLPDNSVDSIVTDPPYGLSDNKFVADTIAKWISGERDFIPDGKGFMGKSWDAFVPPPALWDECLRVLKPGGHLLAFFGSRTQDIGALSIRLAGFEIRDSIAWLSNKTFPKSLDISKAIDKGTGENRQRQLKFVNWMRSTGITAREANAIVEKADIASHYFRLDQPAIATADLFDKLRPYLPEVPEEIERLVAERTGIEWTAYRNREVIGSSKGMNGSGWGNVGHGLGTTDIKITAPSTPEAKQWEGWGTALKPVFEPIVVARKPLIGTVAQNVLTHGTGGLNIAATRVNDRWPSNVAMSDDMAHNLEESVYFFVPKATKRDRSEGLEGENFHPTVKPTDLMRYLVKLVTPPNGTVLDPFTGSGSTGKAAILEGFDFIGIELTEDYIPIIEGRLAHAEQQYEENQQKKDEALF